VLVVLWAEGDLNTTWQDIEGYVVVGTSDTARFAKGIASFVPSAKNLTAKIDGTFRPLALGLPIAKPTELALDPRGAVLAVGARGKQAANSALASPPAASPLFLLSADYGHMARIAKRTGTIDPQAAVLDAVGLLDAQAAMLGRMTLWSYIEPRGLGFRMRMELKRPDAR
jgi:hypothetical protein